MKKQKNEMANIIYDTLFKNTNWEQFDTEKAFFQYVDLTNNVIRFMYGTNEKNIKAYELSIKGIMPLCPHCEKGLTKSKIKGYSFECLECDEDFYFIEVKL